MRKIVLLFCCFISLSLFGQEPVFEWAKQLGGNEVDEANSITTDSSGNVIVIGRFEGTADFDPGPGIYNLSASGGDDYPDDIFVSKLDSNGQFIWASSFGDYDRNILASEVITDITGNVYITGSFEGTVDFDPGPEVNNLTSIGDRDIFVLKLNSNGTLIWVRNIGDTYIDLGRDIVLDNNDNIYITGSFEGTVDFDPGPDVFILLANGGDDDGYDVFILKLNSNGDFVWAKSIGGEYADYGNSIALDSMNNIYTIGNFRGNVDFDPGIGVHYMSATGGKNLFISKLNSDGDFIWAKMIGSPGTFVYGRDVEIDDLGNVYTIGFYSDMVDFDPGIGVENLSPVGGSDIFISKLDTEGNYIWAKTFGEVEQDRGIDLALDKSDNVIATGYFDGTVDFDPGPDTFNLSGNYNIYILKLDFDGSFIWAGSFSGIGGNSSNSITIDNSDNIYTTGYFQDTMDFDPDIDVFELTSHGSRDAFIHKMSQQPCNASTVINSSNSSLTICIGESIELTAEMFPLVDTDIIYAWNTGETSDSIIITPDSSSIYSVEVEYLTEQGICIGTASVMVTVIENDTTYLDVISCDSMDVGSITFDFLNQYGCDSLVVKITSWLSVPETPIAPDNIIIQENDPPFEITVPAVPNATEYVWAVPNGVQILSGAGTNSITVDWNGMSTGGFICVNAMNECGSSLSDCMEVTVDILDTVKELEKKDYAIFPNPTTFKLNIVFEDAQTFEMTIFDVLGNTIITPTKYVGQSQIDVSQLSSGIYWLKMKINSEVFWERVEVLH